MSKNPQKRRAKLENRLARQKKRHAELAALVEANEHPNGGLSLVRLKKLKLQVKTNRDQTEKQLQMEEAIAAE